MTIKLMVYNNYDCISLSEYPEQINTKEITEEIIEEIKNIIKDETDEIKNLIKSLDTDKNTDWIKKLLLYIISELHKEKGNLIF